jgi:O-antigen biosynthesis alpha-1,2-mannosyltransferase
MRIGIMLRSIDEKGGIGIYSRYITEELLKLDKKNEYVLFYRNKENLSRFSNYDHVKKKVVYAPNKAFWDQVAIPYAAKREGIDVIFHPKFTVPIFTGSKTVMVLHGADWFIPEFAKFYGKYDIMYIRKIMPVYCKKADYIISVSELTTMHFINILGVNPNKIKTIYFGANEYFQPITDPKVLEEIKQKYHLPDEFVLTVTGYDPNRKERKNFGGVLGSFQKLHEKYPAKLVVVGKECWRYKEDYKIDDRGWGGDILFTGWVEQKDLPAFYNLASLYLYPSNVEAFPIPLCEAMACGCPIVTSNANGLYEIAGDAAILVDPDDSAGIAHAMFQILTDHGLRKTLGEKGLQRSKMFSWKNCAKETLEVFEGLNHN